MNINSFEIHHIEITTAWVDFGFPSYFLKGDFLRLVEVVVVAAAVAAAAVAVAVESLLRPGRRRARSWWSWRTGTPRTKPHGSSGVPWCRACTMGEGSSRQRGN